MDRWIVYIQERFPFLTYIALIAGLSLSGIFLNESSFTWFSFFVSFIGIWIFFFLLRLIGDVKDFEKDRIAYPERPLPRGVIKKSAAENLVDTLLLILFAYSIIIWVMIHEAAALTYAFAVFYLRLYYRNFYAGEWLCRHPLLFGVLRQLFVFPIIFFAATVGRSDAMIFPSTWSFAAMMFGAFFCYDICLKLDPHTHPVIASYIHLYGFRKSFELAVLSLSISAMSAAVLNLSLFLFPCQLLVLAALALLFFQPHWFKIPEIVAGLSLMLHAWSVVLHYYQIS